jgi:hypothetical protein
MNLRLRTRRGRRAASARSAAMAAVALVIAVVAGCSGGVQPSVPSGVCATDTRAPGQEPDLERTLPQTLRNQAPTSVDSGVNCTVRSLGTYASHGIAELRYAGATWDHGGGSATVIAAVAARPAGAPALEAAWVEEFYEAGARAGRKTDNIAVSRPVIADDGNAFRLDTLNDLSFQTVLVWPEMGFVRVVIVATTVGPGTSREAHEQRVDAAGDTASMAPDTT